MLNFIKKLASNDLLKVFSFTGLSTLIKLLTSYISIKVVAAVIGPGGIALIGQLQNFAAVFTTLGAGGINNGVIKYVSEYKAEETELQKFLGNGFKITVCFSSFFGLILILFASHISKWVLLDSQYFYVFICFGLSLLLLSLNNYFLSILNGFKEFRKFVIINIVTSVLGLIITVTLVLSFHLPGALIAAVTYQSLVVFVTLFFLIKTPWFKASVSWGRWNREIVTKYFYYAMMAIVSAVTVPVSQFLVRGFIIRTYSLVDAGYWEGMNRISGLYLLFFTTSFTVYYLPKLSELKTEALLKQEIIKTYKIMAPIIALSLILIYCLKNVVITLLFTKDFYPMKELFMWQLLGDFFKIMSWILAFVMVAKSMTKTYIITEIFFSSLFVGLSVIFVNHFGLIGVTQSYCLNYFLYFVIMVILFKNIVLSRKA